MKKTLLTLSFFLFALTPAQHKFLNAPSLNDEDVKREKSIQYPDAPAEVLYRSVHMRVDFDGKIYKDVINRVKIYDKDNASKFLDHELSLYHNNKGDREVLNNLKAYTYNWDNGKKVETKVERNEKYESKEDKNYSITKFAFPNVKDGSVVEYAYQIYTPFIGSTERVLIEDEIPVRYVEYLFDTPKQIGYNINYKGELIPTHREVSERLLYNHEYNIYRFAYENVPPYKDEKYVLNSNNYKTGLKAEISSLFLENGLKSYALTWKDISNRLFENDNFGYELKKQNLVKDLLPSEIKGIAARSDRAKAVLQFVQKNYSWDKQDNVTTDNGLRNLLSTKVGNSAELNLLLILLLRSADIDANPVVLSTVKHGSLQGYLPSLAQLNFVLAAYKDGEKINFLDASSKNTDLNMVSPRALNYSGYLLTKNNAEEVKISYPEMSKTHLTVDAIMKPDASFEGHFADRDSKLYGMMVNESYLEDKQKYAKSYEEEYKFGFSDLKSGLQENKDFETSFNFAADTFADVLGSKIVFNPLLFLYSQKHDFDQKETRKAPLEFYSASNRIKKVTVTIPDNYSFENIPKSKKFRTDDNFLQYSYVVTQEGNKLTVETSTIIDDVNFPAEYYPIFRQIYDNITKMEAQLVTAVKK